MPADERYRKLLGIEPAGDVPTHYELLVVERSVTDHAVIEGAYKAQMTKLQQIKTSKDKGFIEFLKEELRSARLTLTTPDRRRAYDETLSAGALADFKTFVTPFMEMGFVPRSVFDTMVAKAVRDGLSKDLATSVIKELAKQKNATLQTEDAPAAISTAPPSAASARLPRLGDADDDPSATHADTGDADGEPFVDTGEEPAYADEYQGQHEAEEAYDDSGDDAVFSDEADGAPPPPPPPAPLPSGAGGLRPPPMGRSETVLKAPPGAAVRPPSAPPATPAQPAAQDAGSKIQRGRFYDFADSYQPEAPAEPAKPVSPWARGGSTAPRPAWSRSSDPGSSPPAPSPAAANVNQDTLKNVAEGRRLYNAGAKLARIANDLHAQLAQYFPPTNGKSAIVYNINGVSFEKVFDSEQKTYKDALKKFEDALEKVGSVGIPAADEVRQRAGQAVSLIKGYVEEIRQHKLRRLSPMSKPDELRLWQTFVQSNRSGKLTQTLDER